MVIIGWLCLFRSVVPLGLRILTYLHIFVCCIFLNVNVMCGRVQLVFNIVFDAVVFGTRIFNGFVKYCDVARANLRDIM